MFDLPEAFRALGDPTRLRILRLVGEARLNVSEVVSLIGVAQSSVSHHLARLKNLELIREERQASFTYYSLAIDASDPRWPLISLAREADDEHGDQARLTELLQRREDRQTLNEKLLEPGQSWRLWATALSSLLPPLEVVDFGCGSGVLTVELARWAKRVTAIDRSEAALAQAAERAQRFDNVRFLNADLSDLPASVKNQDLVIISQSLHHVEDPRAVLAQALRVLKPGGKAVVLELMPHQEQWVQSQLGHRQLGFEPVALQALMAEVGFQGLELVPSARDGATPFRAFLLSGCRGGLS